MGTHICGHWYNAGLNKFMKTRHIPFHSTQNAIVLHLFYACTGLIASVKYLPEPYKTMADVGVVIRDIYFFDSRQQMTQKNQNT